MRIFPLFAYQVQRLPVIYDLFRLTIPLSLFFLLLSSFDAPDAGILCLSILQPFTGLGQRVLAQSYTDFIGNLLNRKDPGFEAFVVAICRIVSIAHLKSAAD